MTRHLRPVPDTQDALIDVDIPPPPPTAGDLVAAWCSGYTEVRGRQPHASVVKRVAGVCRAIGKDCADDVESWRTAWRAARLAGQQGRWDVVTVLVDDLPVSLYARPGRASAEQSLLGRLRGGALAGEIEP